jgi:cytochrome oxidase Cu insertion factor (SCO1/SenC/PrrC family)
VSLGRGRRLWYNVIFRPADVVERVFFGGVDRSTLMRTILCARIYVAILCAATATFVGCDRQPGRASLPPGALSNEALDLLDLDGNAQNLLATDHGTVTVVVFTCTDCPISNRYAPVIRELHEAYHLRGVDFYLIYADPHDSPEAIRAHLKDYEYPCVALRDPEHTLVAAAGATVTPEAVLIDFNHKIAYRGRIDDRNADFGNARLEAVHNDLADAIEATLAHHPVKRPVTTAVGCYIADLKK